ncbi:MAG: CooT family nickel-binding protein [Desulfobacterales bacterium]|nr:CooT family nickel-binding protein [Desulfobacterales bacterium]
MCEANAYFLKENEKELIMESVDIIEPDKEGHIRIINIFGDQKIIKGHIHSVSLVDHNVFIKQNI